MQDVGDCQGLKCTGHGEGVATENERDKCQANSQVSGLCYYMDGGVLSFPVTGSSQRIYILCFWCSLLDHESGLPSYCFPWEAPLTAGSCWCPAKCGQRRVCVWGAGLETTAEELLNL